MHHVGLRSGRTYMSGSDLDVSDVRLSVSPKSLGDRQYIHIRRTIILSGLQMKGRGIWHVNWDKILLENWAKERNQRTYVLRESCDVTFFVKSLPSPHNKK